MEQEQNTKSPTCSELLEEIIKPLRGHKYINMEKLLEQIVYEFHKNEEFKYLKEEDVKKEA